MDLRSLARSGAVFFALIAAGCGGGGGRTDKKTTTIAPVTTAPVNTITNTAPARLVASTQPASPMDVDTPFALTVELRDASNGIAKATTDMTVAVTATASVGLAPRTPIGRIAAGQTSVIISDLRIESVGSHQLDVRAGAFTLRVPVEVRDRRFAAQYSPQDIRIDEGGPGVINYGSISAVGSFATVVFQDRRAVGNATTVDHVYARSTQDGGLTFGPVTRVDHAPAMSNCWDAACAVNGKGLVAVAWVDTRTMAMGTVQVCVSNDGGKTFAASDVRVDQATTRLFRASNVGVAAEKDVVHVVYRDQRDATVGDVVYYARSLDGGKTFEPEKRIDANTAPGGGARWFISSGTLQIKAQGSDVHVLWYEWITPSSTTTERRLVCASSRDGGTTFAKARVSTGFSASVLDPKLALSGGTVHAAWRDNRASTTTYAIYTRRSHDGGTTWESEVKVPLGTLVTNPYPIDVSLAAAGKTVAISFQATVTALNGSRAFLARSTDGGATFTMTQGDIVPKSIMSSTRVPVVAACGQRILVSWAETIYTNGQRANVSTDSGATFPTTDRRIDTANAPDGYNSILRTAVTTNGVTYVMWREARGNFLAPYNVFLVTAR